MGENVWSSEPAGGALRPEPAPAPASFSTRQKNKQKCSQSETSSSNPSSPGHRRTNEEPRKNAVNLQHNSKPRRTQPEDSRIGSRMKRIGVRYRKKGYD